MQRKQFIGVSFLSLLALLTEKVFGDTIEIPKKKMARTIKDIQICDVPHHPGYTESYYFTLSPYWNNWFALVNGSLPLGITAITNPLNGCVIGFVVDELLVSGATQIVTIDGFRDTGESLGQFGVMFTKGVCVTEVETCCDNEGASLKWLATNGGVMEWRFHGVREFEIRVGDALTFKNINNTIQYSQRKDIYNGSRVTSSSITKEEVLFIKEVKYAIQAWDYDGENIAILIDNDSFRLFKTTDKFFDISVQYIYADELQIQTQ